MQKKISNSYTAEYTYDDRGNILSKKKYAYTTDATDAMTPTEATTFEYKDTGWVDQLVKVNEDTLTYDAGGNVLTYGDKVFTWERGRILKSITEGENTYAYTYDEDGIRTSKTVNGVTTYFNYKGGQIVSQWNENDVYPMVFEYDTDGKPVGFYYNNAHYLYLTNQMGDVFGITNANGTPIVYYQYDEWGNLLSIETAEEGNAVQLAVADVNPLRYRGYYYDTETEYYYLQSRYYDAGICRFINADEPVFLGVGESLAKWNLYSYCENNAVNNVDSCGMISLNSIKNAILKPVKKLLQRVKEIVNKIKITYRTGILTIGTGAIAIAIDAISFAISRVSYFAAKTGLQLLIAWGKSNVSSFFSFAKKYIIENAMNLVKNLCVFLATRMSLSIAWSQFTNGVADKLFGNSQIYRIFNAFSSFGNIVATVFDLMDGKWDDKLAIKIK